MEQSSDLSTMGWVYQSLDYLVASPQDVFEDTGNYYHRISTSSELKDLQDANGLAKDKKRYSEILEPTKCHTAV